MYRHTITCACGATYERSGRTPYDARHAAAVGALTKGWGLAGYGDDTRGVCPSCVAAKMAGEG